jgi:hypothetical protein
MGFWTTVEGILMRLFMLSESIEFGHFNEVIVRVSTENLREVEFTFTGPINENICPICLQYVGEHFKLGEFPIALTSWYGGLAHPNCAHWWELYAPEATEIA